MSEDHAGHTNRERVQHREERKKDMEKGTKVERNNEKPKQLKPGKDPTQVQIPKPKKKSPPDLLSIDQNQKNNKIPKHDQEHTTDQTKFIIQKPTSTQKLPVQRPTTHHTPQTVNATGSDKDTQTDQEPESVEIPVITQNPLSEKDSTPGQKLTPDRALIKPPDQEKKSSEKIPKINQNPKPNEKHTDLVTGQKTKQKGKPKPEQRPQTNQGLRTLRPDQISELNPKTLPKAESNKTSKLRPTPKGRQPIGPTIRPGATHVKRLKPAVPQKPSLKIKTDLDPLQISETTLGNIKNSETDMSSSPAPVTQTSEASHSQRGTEFSPSTTKTMTPGPKTSNSLETGPIPRRDTLSEGFTMSPNSRITSDPTPLTASRPPLIPTTARANKISRRILPSVIPSTIPGSTNPNQASNTDLQAEIIPNIEERAAKQTPVPDTIMIPVPSPSTQRSTTNKYISPVHDTGGSETTSITTRPIQKPIAVLTENSDENPLTEPVSEKDSTPGQKLTPDRALIKPPDQEKKSSEKIPKINQNLKPNEKHTDLVTGQKTKQKGKPKPEQRPQTNQGLRTLRPDQISELNPKTLPKAESNKTSKLRPTPKGRQPIRPTIRPGATHVKIPKPAVPQKPSLKIKTDLDPLQISETTLGNIKNSETDMSSSPAPVTQTSEASHSQRGTEFSPSTTKTMTLGPKTSNSLETGPIPRRDTLSEGFTMSPSSRITSDPTPLTASRPPLIPTTTRANKISRRILPSVIPSTIPGSTNPNQASNTDLQAEIIPNIEERAAKQTPVPDTIMIPVPSPSTQTTSTINPNLRSTTSSPKPLVAKSSTPSARELRVKIKQVAAFFNNSLITRDCSDYLAKGATKSGMYLVTPDLRSRSFPVFCDMQLDGGGWTVLQRRQDGSVSFNRTWAEYRLGFGELDKGEFWLGNNMIHMLTRARNMVLRVELEDFGGVKEYAQYESFSVASERGRYRLTVGDYSGTAGDALRFSKSYDHHNRAFTTPDRDHDRYPSGNCGAYYSSGWWFDACMAANLNGKYYVGKYKGVRDGIFWGTWQNISSEYYPTNDRQSFKTVRMMIRPRGLAPLAGTLHAGTRARFKIK
ncbi:hypothetical protein F7725_022741 [Dissostichus mawsoni]|uniref:Fibrinogen C-terminal domain-containing protein n=1 Tax=Dissostichus mawsoni TaxID=36200 RepID=A0A7J5YZ28_DISMA|nr:hypothetical protein F7725_022741 [Dissostichus mawsoni]